MALPPTTRSAAQVAAWCVLPSPFGPIHAAATSRGVVGVTLHSAAEPFLADVARRLGAPPATRDAADPEAVAILDHLAAELAEYAAGQRTEFDVPLDLRTRSAWDRAVLEAVRGIGHGRVTSYGRLARLAGSPGAARAAGGAVGRNPIGLLVPCHRVIAGDGTIGGYGGSWYGSREELLDLKRALLAHEGVALPARSLVGPA
jgi:methylated-DNA-[protein]-cysteine S-methyltransferase